LKEIRRGKIKETELIIKYLFINFSTILILTPNVQTWRKDRNLYSSRFFAIAGNYPTVIDLYANLNAIHVLDI